MKGVDNKILTILIPTYNRAEMLKYTMDLMSDQLKRNTADVDVIICDNASTDRTSEVIRELLHSGLDVEYIRYEEHVDVGNSITRSVENVNTPFFQLWSDDDLPSPMMVDMILNILKKYPTIGALSFNRINGYGVSEKPNHIQNLSVFNPIFELDVRYYKSSREYAEERFSEIDFVSINILSINAWKKGMRINNNNHYGFQFVAPILYGIQGYPCIYVDYPLCIKRNPPVEFVEYAKKWPLYAFVGMPRVLYSLQELGVISDAKEAFKNYRYNQSTKEYIYNIFKFGIPNKDFYTPYVEEMISYQSDKMRIFVTKIILWPKFLRKTSIILYKVLRKCCNIIWRIIAKVI